MNLLPTPRSLDQRAGFFLLPRHLPVQLDASLTPFEAHAVTQRLWSIGKEMGIDFVVSRSSGAPNLPIKPPLLEARRLAPFRSKADEFYQLEIGHGGILIEFNQFCGLRASVATLRQLLREHRRRLPCLRIRDWPDFARRGVMLDISRGRVPNLETLLDLASHLADFKINELQLYTEHTFAYRKHKSVWRDWGAMTAAEIRKLDERCRELGIDLVPNQNSFGHLREFLASPKLAHLAEISKPWPDAGGSFWRYPSTLAPSHPSTLKFLRELYDELLPNFTSEFFNVGCDETWDLGRGRSKALCQKIGRERVYLKFIRRIRREVSRRGKRMMFWGDIILRQPKLILELPKDVIALNWGYEANHPFRNETRAFARAGVPFYVCPGTSTWATLVGRHDNAFANLRAAARAGRGSGALGYLITDWGDGGHPQPLAVSWLPFAFGASMAWCERAFDESALLPVTSREVFYDPSGRTARAALALGLVHQRLGYSTPNATPLGETIAAPTPESHELFCRDGLKYYARIRASRIQETLNEIEQQRALLHRNRATTNQGKMLAAELDLAARMAAQSCKIMLWQKALAARKRSKARTIAQAGIRELEAIERDFNVFWPHRNKATPGKCSPFFQWRIADYVCARLHYSPKVARRI